MLQPDTTLCRGFNWVSNINDQSSPHWAYFRPIGPLNYTSLLKSFSLRDRLFFLVWFLISSQEKLVCRWYVQHAAIRHCYLLLCIHFSIAFVHSVFILKNLVLVNRRQGQRYQRVLVFCAFSFFF